MSPDLPASVALVVNPTSGQGRGARTGDRIRALLARRGLDVSSRVTRSADDVEVEVRRALAAGAARVVVVGGDGTLNRAVRPLLTSDAVLGIVPCGRGNDVARALGIPTDLDAAAEVVADGRVRAIDAAGDDDVVYLTATTFGVDAEVSAMAHRGEVPGSGRVVYVRAALRVLARARPTPATVTGDFGSVTGEFLLVAAANTRSYGGGIPIAPAADPADGLLDVCMVHAVSRPAAALLLARLLVGRHVGHRAVRTERTRTLRIDTAEPRTMFADGEPYATTPATIRVRPKALRVLTP